MKREFTGVFIPAHIWTSKEVTAIGKMLLAEVDSLSQSTGWCYASRAHFAEWLGTTESNLSLHFKRLSDAGFLEIERIPGETNKMRVVATRFHIKEGVRKTYGGGKENLRGGVRKTYGGGKENLPVNTIERKEEREEGEAPAPAHEFSPLEAKPLDQVHSAGAGPGGGPHIRDFVKADTPTEMLDRMRVFYATDQGANELEAIKAATIAGRTPVEKFKSVTADFAAWAVEQNFGQKTFRELNARFFRWWKEQPNHYRNIHQQSPAARRPIRTA